ncbi:hypothetical protein OZX69_03175 [Lactobacillus sp. ESL0731]|uniref:hypothetical protein n=1 Tax=unclassified Lactobacillus TaxID=2620435 RepID=UPI0023F63F1F|nr:MULTISPECIES: hypothetical protein [unclassified Lactobacillus]WEV51711.1 hypothetical protein OZX63_03175 [Lactobacillus sp. ESL0700]WEV62840.1 hypothetical protein OZX69_03175 [Lactobacillus sp. ESL0731]
MKQAQEELTFVGRPFPDAMMDQEKSFSGCNLEMENDAAFQKFLKSNHLTSKRSSLVVFGPENFMYWYGVIAPKEIEVPAGLMKFVLPQTQVARVELPEQSLAFFNQPLNFVLPELIGKVTDAGIQVYENMGDSLTPYILQSLDLDTKKLSQDLYLEDSK